MNNVIVKYNLDIAILNGAKRFYENKPIKKDDIIDFWFYGYVFFLDPVNRQHLFVTEAKVLGFVTQINEFLTVATNQGYFMKTLYDMEQLYEITLIKNNNILFLKDGNEMIEFDYSNFAAAFLEMVNNLLLEIDLLCPEWENNNAYQVIKEQLNKVNL